MAQTTRQAIIDCTIKLAESKPLKKITIYDIVNSCGITRNTFYYYFHDIYDVFDQMVHAEIDKLSDIGLDDYSEEVFNLIEFVVMYKKLWLNLYKAVGAEPLAKYVKNELHGIILTYVKKAAGERNVPDTDLCIISSFYEEALFGVLTRWLRGEPKGNSPEEMHLIANRIRILFKGSLMLMLENSIKNPM